jgi:ABC-type metal ion transport system substrate-binding protein
VRWLSGSSRQARALRPLAANHLAKLLTSPEVKQFIDSHYKGAVLAAF